MRQEIAQLRNVLVQAVEGSTVTRTPTPVLATIFNRPGVYDSPDAFDSGFRSALWVAVIFTAIATPHGC